MTDAYNKSVLIPLNLVAAARSAKNFEAEHLRYWVRHGGQYGLCNYRQAFEYLVSDMRQHGLPVRWSNYGSFRVVRDRRRG